MSAIGNVSLSPQIVALRPITADDLKNVKTVELGPGTPLKPGQFPDKGTTASSPLLASNDDQQAAANAAERRAEAFAKMKVALQTKNGTAGV